MLKLHSSTRKSKTLSWRDNSQTNGSYGLFGCSHFLFQSWTEFQLRVEDQDQDTTIENYWSEWRSDLTLPCMSKKLIEETETSNCLNWKT